MLISNITESMGSENYNLKLMKMYLDEHIDFVNGVSNEDSLDLTTKCWIKYHSVIEDLQNEFKKLDNILKEGGL